MTTGASAAGDQVSTDSAAGPSQNLVQPKIRFPTTLKRRKHRSFNFNWYKQYHWLEYSRGRDVAYCYPCHLFITESGRYSETFTKGFCDWKHAMEKDGIIPCHDHCKIHMQAIVCWQEFVNKASGTSIADRLDAARSQLIAKNRQRDFRGNVT